MVNTQRVCYTILETETNIDDEYIPCIVKEGESGYFRTDWLWGKDIKIARQCAEEKNEALGHSIEDVQKIVASSMTNIMEQAEKPEQHYTFTITVCGQGTTPAGAFDNASEAVELDGLGCYNDEIYTIDGDVG